MESEDKIICVGADHAGFLLKERVIEMLQRGGYVVIDHGCFSEEAVDYPDYIHPVASSVGRGECRRGIIMCGSGNGVSMTANKHPNVRAALCWQEDIVTMARLHNDANILALPARYLAEEEALKMVKTFLDTPFEGGRHQRRTDKINLRE